MDKDKQSFLGHLRLRDIEAACDAMGISRHRYYQWRTDDPEFAKKADEAKKAKARQDVYARRVRSLIEVKKKAIIGMLKEQNKYTPEMSMQVIIAARLMVRHDLLAEEIFAADHQSVRVEISREGNPRESLNPKEKLFLDLSRECQKALRALGMNNDARERKPADDDGFNDFMESFKLDR